jgi:hypothetical protein
VGIGGVEVTRKVEPLPTLEEQKEREIENYDLNLILGLPVDFQKGRGLPRALKTRRLLTPEQRAEALRTLPERLLAGFKIDPKTGKMA